MFQRLSTSVCLLGLICSNLKHFVDKNMLQLPGRLPCFKLFISFTWFSWTERITQSFLRTHEKHPKLIVSFQKQLCISGKINLLYVRSSRLCIMYHSQNAHLGLINLSKVSLEQHPQVTYCNIHLLYNTQ